MVERKGGLCEARATRKWIWNLLPIEWSDLCQGETDKQNPARMSAASVQKNCGRFQPQSRNRYSDFRKESPNRGRDAFHGVRDYFRLGGDPN